MESSPTSPAPATPPSGRAGTRSIVPSLRVKHFNDMKVRHGARALIKGALPEKSFAMLYGPSGSGKTFVAAHIALCVGAGREFQGKKTRPGRVAYVATENPASVEQRFAGICRELHIEKADISLIEGDVNLIEPASVEALIGKLTELMHERGGPSLVVIDTAAQAMPGADENTSKDMGAFVSACLRIRDQFETCVLVVHHSGKNVAMGARGHSVLHAAVDVELEINEVEGVRVVTVTKARDGKTGIKFGFKLRSIPLGRDADGEMMTTCVVETADVPAAKSRDAKKKVLKGKHQKSALEALNMVLGTHGRALPGAPEGVNAVTIDEWRDEWYKKVAQLDSSHRATRFADAVTGLKNAEVVDSNEEAHWLRSSVPTGRAARSSRDDSAANSEPFSQSQQCPEYRASEDALGDFGAGSSADGTESGEIGDFGDAGERTTLSDSRIQLRPH